MTGREKIASVVSVAIGLSVGLVASLEGYSPTPYRDVAGILTECYGNTHGVKLGTVKTQEECQAILETEIGRIAQVLIKDQPNHNPNTLASGISFVYNVGDGAYRKSTYRKKLLDGDFEGACYELNKWVYITSKGVKVESRGLKNRRAKEVELCLTPYSD